MKAKIEIKMDNAAFTNSAYPEEHESQKTAAFYELATILEELAMRARFCNESIQAKDTNGNTVGYLEVSND